MYLYFDSNGYLKEFINDPIREGAQNVNKLYVYVEPSTNKTKTVTIDGVERGVYAFLSTYTTGTVDYKLDDEEITTESFVLDHTHDLVYEQIPFDKKRDLKCFKYFEYYEFLKLTIPSTVTSGSGRVDCSVNLTDPLDSASSQLIFPLDMINFMVQDSAIVKNIPITRAQYSYLLAMLKGEISLDYVPYTGAEADVDLGSYKITANAFYLGTQNLDDRYVNTDGDIVAGDLIVKSLEQSVKISCINGNSQVDLTTYVYTSIPRPAFQGAVYVYRSDEVYSIYTVDRIVTMDGHFLIHPVLEENEVIATREWAENHLAQGISIAADVSIPYRYTFSLLNSEDEAISSTTFDLQAEQVQEDLEAYVDNAVDTLETELDGRLDTLEAKHVYEHNITVSGSSAGYEVEAKFVIVSSSATEINTQALLATALYGNPRGCSGYYKDKTYSHMWVLCKILRDDATRVAVTYIDLDNQTTSNIVISSASVSDTVTTVY